MNGKTKKDMVKKYKSNSLVSLNVVLPTGGNTHVSFSAMTGGGSVYYTSNADIQKGLESHPKYGKLFVLDASLKSGATQVKQALAVETDSKALPRAKKAIVVKMLCNDDAKDYLADKFGVSRSKMRSRADIERTAEANGVEIIWV